MNKQREYLVEDLALIRRYFPGAQAIALSTPFDLTAPEDPWQLRADDGELGWHGDLLWSR